MSLYSSTEEEEEEEDFRRRFSAYQIQTL